MKKYATIFALSCAAIASPAWAEEEKNFEGPRVEGLVGYDRFNLDVPDIQEGEANSEDVFYGAAIGYDFQSVGIVFGVEAELASSGNGESVEVVETINGSLFDGTVSLEDGVNWYAGGRVGALAGDNGLFYFKAGFAHTTLDLDASGTIDGEPASDSADISFSGVRLGGGYEHSLGNAYAKIEYRYTSYSDGDVEYDGETADLQVLGDYDLTRHQIVAGLGFRF